MWIIHFGRERSIFWRDRPQYMATASPNFWSFECASLLAQKNKRNSFTDEIRKLQFIYSVRVLLERPILKPHLAGCTLEACCTSDAPNSVIQKSSKPGSEM